MNRKLKLWGVALSIILMLAGCASNGPARDIDDPGNSLIFGYIDMEDAPTSISQASLMHVLPATEPGYWQLGVDNGLLYNQYLPEGSYQIAHFGGSSFLKGAHNYTFPGYGRNATAVRVKVPGIYFVGAYKYQKVDTGMFEGGKFNMVPTESPNEKELLQRLAGMKWVVGTQWESRISARLAELNR